MTHPGWLLFLYALPSGRNSLRVDLWRRLKKAGAVALKTSASLLPDTPGNYELFQWLAKLVADGGGEATLIRAKEIDNLAHAQVVALFHEARNADYVALARAVTQLLRRRRRAADPRFVADLERLRIRFAEIQNVDHFSSPRAHDVQMLLQKAAGRQPRERAAPILRRADHRGRTWLTRPRPQIDRVGSAWLIRSFIDPEAKFVFGTREEHPTAVPYDMAGVELTHQGEDCTFETLLRRFGLKDQVLKKIATMVHDADLHDEKFHAPGAEGIDRVLEGVARLGWPDEKILQLGLTCFAALYAQVKAT